MTDNKQAPNPTGKGGFGDHPENRNPGGWDKTVSFSYQYKRFMAMKVDELAEWMNEPIGQKTVVEEAAFYALTRAKKSLADVKEITDRTEGKAPQFIGLGDPDDFNKVALVKFMDDEPESSSSQDTK